MVIRQVDAITAYLNSYLDEPVYMEVPETLTMILEEIIKRNKRNDGYGKQSDTNVEKSSKWR